MLKPLNEKNHVETKSEKFVTKIYMFDITKCDEIFDLLVFGGQIVIPKGLKTPPLEQRKKKDFVNFIIPLVKKLLNVYFSGTWCRTP